MTVIISVITIAAFVAALVVIFVSLYKTQHKDADEHSNKIDELMQGDDKKCK